MPAWLRPIVRAPVRFVNRALGRFRRRAAPRLLGRGNSEIFREVAREFARFIEAFGSGTARDRREWQRYRETIAPSEPSELFPAADIELMRGAFESYYEAMYADDVRRQAELVLRGNLLLADYEQQRVDPIVRVGAQPLPESIAERRP